MIKKKLVSLLIGLLLFVNLVSAAGVGEFVGNLIPDSITKSLESMRIFFYDFMSFVLDIFTILLFIIWIASIGGIIYVIVWLVSLPKKAGANNFHDAVVNISGKLWDFMR